MSSEESSHKVTIDPDGNERYLMKFFEVNFFSTFALRRCFPENMVKNNYGF